MFVGRLRTLNLHAFTDAHGEFRIRPLPRGRYRIHVRKTSFARLTDPDAPTIDVAAGQSVTGVELALHTGAVIAGRIVDSGGAPPSAVIVTALRQQTGPDGQTLAPTAQMAETNDLGEFRIEGLGEGDYLVIASPPPPPPFASLATPPALVPAPTYYPGTPDRDTAQVLTVASGQAVDNLHFSLLLLPSHEVSGVVVDAAGAPVAGVIVALMVDPTKGGTATPATGQTDQEGAFRIAGIVSGSYQLMAGGGGPPAQGSPNRSLDPAGTGSLGGVAVNLSAGPNRGVGGVIAGGVFFGGGPPLEITVGDTDVTGLRIVLPTRR